MQITYFGHSCFLLTEADTNLLFDPGNLAANWENLTNLAGICITHQHPDHMDLAKLPLLLANNPQAFLLSESTTLELLKENIKFTNPTLTVNPGEKYSVNNLEIEGFGGEHALILPEIPRVNNIGFLVGTKNQADLLFHPGDSLQVPTERDIEVLALPVAAPWMNIQAGVAFYQAVNPHQAFPIHFGIIAEHAKEIYFSKFREFGPSKSKFTVLPTQQATLFTD